MNRRRALPIWSATVALAFFGQLGAGHDAQAAEPVVAVCGIAKPVDELLCPGDSAPDPGTGTSGNQPDSSASGQSAIEAGTLDRTREAPAKPRLRYDGNLIAVSFKRGTSDADARALLARAGAPVERVVAAIRAYTARVEPASRAEVLARLRASARVADAGREILAEALETIPNDRLWSYQNGLRLAGFPRAWDTTRGSSDVVVAVVDTGVDPTHTDLVGALLPGYDFVNDDADARDDEGHGTAVAGLIASRANNGEGVAGTCWACLVLPVKALNASGSGGTTQVAAGIVWAADHGADVINLSLGASATTSALSDAIAYAVRKGAIVVAAAGNEGASLPFYPAAEPFVLSVAGTDLDDHLYPWSNRGAWVRTAAPGCNVTPVPGGYGNFCGTSSAAPVVAGLAALARAIAPTAQSVDIERAIEETAARVDNGVQPGRIDAAATLARLTGAQESSPDTALRTTVTLQRTLRSGQAATYRRTVGGGLVSATLTFPRQARLTLSIAQANGSKAASSGKPPLHLERTVPTGAITLTVSGARRKTAFVLTVSYPAVAAQRVSLSPVQPAPPLDGGTIGASIGRPALPRGERMGVASVGLEAVEASEPPLVAEVNAVRRRFRLRPLRVSPRLAQAADAHAASMGLRGYFGHEWSDGTPFARWILRYYPAHAGRAWLAGENLIWAAPALEARQAVKAWLASRPHRKNLLDPRWRELGIGVVRARGAGGVYGGYDVDIGVAEFGRR